MLNRTQLLKDCITKAGQILLNISPDSIIETKSGRGNFVTQADLESQKIIIDSIKKHFPNDQIFSEETVNTIDKPFEIAHLWIIDPLDGTNNFRYQRHYSSVSIGYAEKGVVKAGAIFDPYHQELFFAELNKGSYLNNHPIHVGSQTNIHQASVNTDNSYNSTGTERNIHLLQKLKPLPWILMRGSAALILSEIASERSDLYFHTTLTPFDIAAGILIVKEAGGTVKDIQGKDVTFMSKEIVAGNTSLVQQFVHLVNKNLSD